MGRRREGTREVEAVGERKIGCDGEGVRKALAIAPAKNVHRDGKLVARHFGLSREIARIDIDQFHHPVAVGSTGRCDEIHSWRARGTDRMSEDIGLITDEIDTVCECSLIGEEPSLPEFAV